MGTVKPCSSKGGYGFIASELGDADIFVHACAAGRKSSSTWWPIYEKESRRPIISNRRTQRGRRRAEAGSVNGRVRESGGVNGPSPCSGETFLFAMCSIEPRVASRASPEQRNRARE